jgi:hypothetical protein
VGDKAGRVYLEAVQEYLTHSWLKWDAGLLASMFQEADYAGNGFLTAKDLSATLSGRYPKRQHTADWRALVAGLMGVEQLILLEVDREPISEAELRQHRKVGRVGGAEQDPGRGRRARRAVPRPAPSWPSSPVRLGTRLLLPVVARPAAGRRRGWGQRPPPDGAQGTTLARPPACSKR